MDKSIKYKVLIIDTDKNIHDYLDKKLREDGYEVVHLFQELETIEIINKEMPHCVIMEINLPNLKGRTLISEIKNSYPEIQVIVLTNDDSSQSVVRSFRRGADDYLTKPFSVEELLIRLKTRIKTNLHITNSNILKYRDIKIDLDKKLVYKKNKHLRLSKKEYKLLEFFIKNKEIVFSRNDLLDKVWGSQKFVVKRSVDVYIGRLRDKLEIDKSKYIHTRRGFGYIFK